MNPNSLEVKSEQPLQDFFRAVKNRISTRFVKSKDSSDQKSEQLLQEIFQAFIWRDCSPKESVTLLARLEADGDWSGILRWMLEHPRHKLTASNIGYPPGHCYSALVDIEEAKEYLPRVSTKESDVFNAINIDFEEMDSLWKEMEPCFESAPWDLQPQSHLRYYYRHGSYGFTDALVLSALLQVRTPKRFIEVGSGATSAVLLDTLEHLMSAEIDLTFIQPYPKALQQVVREEDKSKYKLITDKVQNVDICLYDQLEAGDMLFIDSTHIAKTGSDVVHEIIEILPRLKPGVLIHFHDIFYPFEYPAKWIVEGSRSWNEMYMLRAYLQDNPSYRIVMFNNYYVKMRQSESAYRRERFVQNPGGGIWLERLAKAEK
jgi:predicted O-methyltransferase YrrM